MRRPEDVTAIGQLVKVLDCLPLAIELAARARPRHGTTRPARPHEGSLRRAALARRAARPTGDLAGGVRLVMGTAQRSREGDARAPVGVRGRLQPRVRSAVVGWRRRRARSFQVDLVHWLVDKSFVRQVSDDRFDLLESVREYAAQHLRTAGAIRPERPGLRSGRARAHWRYFATHRRDSRVADRCAELSNLVAACRAAAIGGRRAICGRVPRCALGRRCGLTGPYRAGVELGRGGRRDEHAVAIETRRGCCGSLATRSTCSAMSICSATRRAWPGVRFARAGHGLHVRLLIVLGEPADTARRARGRVAEPDGGIPVAGPRRRRVAGVRLERARSPDGPPIALCGGTKLYERRSRSPAQRGDRRTKVDCWATSEACTTRWAS